MRNHFSVIRRRLPESTTVRRYALYAAGEVLLVVTGILIALQVNNWNEDRLSQLKKQSYMRELVENLESDLREIDELIEFNEQKDTLITEALTVLIDGSDDSDIAIKLAKGLYGLTMFDRLQIKDVAFENLTATGSIDLLENPQLRGAITDYYQQRTDLETGTQKRLAEVVREFADTVTPLIIGEATIHLLFETDHRWQEEVSLSTKQKRELLGLLYSMRDNTRYQSESVRRVRETTEALLEQITGSDEA